MALQDITPDFFRFWDQSRGRAPEDQQRLWRDLYEEPHRLLFMASEGRHGSPDQLPAALARLGQEMPRIRASLPFVRTAIDRTGPELAALFTLDRFDSRWVLYEIRVNASSRGLRPHPLAPSPSALGEGERASGTPSHAGTDQPDSVLLVGMF